MSTPRAHRLLMFAAVTSMCAFALAGCSGEGDSDSGATAVAEVTPGPLDEYMAQIEGYDLGAADVEVEAQVEEQNARIEELTATCMQEQGFDYTPVDYSDQTVYADADLDAEWGSLEFAQTYGYGISTDPWGIEDEVPDDDGEDDSTDPNADYVDSMSQSEQDAYWAALYGSQATTEESEGDVVDYDWTTAGCSGYAMHELGISADASDEYADLSNEVDLLYSSVDSDERMVELESSWSSCMAAQGFDGLSTVNEASNALSDEYSELQGWDDPEYTALIENWDWEAEPDGPAAPEVDEAELKAFKEKEISQAVADFNCQQEVDYIATQQKISDELQQEFVDEHRDELQAWVDAATAARDE